MARSVQPAHGPAARSATARLTRRAPSEPPAHATVWRSGGRPNETRLAACPWGVRSKVASSGHTGVPVTWARGRPVSAKATAFAAAWRPSRPLTAPGTASVVMQTSGTLVSTAANPAGKLAYPPTTTTTRGRRRRNEPTARAHAEARPATAPALAHNADGRMLRCSPRPWRSV
jgi:hypothetical protein